MRLLYGITNMLRTESEHVARVDYELLYFFDMDDTCSCNVTSAWQQMLAIFYQL